MIKIAARLIDQITRAAQDAYPNECCGLLGGHGDLDGDVIITRVQPSKNVAQEGIRDRFEVDPKVRFDLMRKLEGGQERIIGHYHSHPDHSAMPSQHDLKMAFEPDLLWLIIALEDGRVTDTRAHRIDVDASTFQEVPLSVE
ncbi:MAG: M67 family metallopeptidase [Rhodospirillales bacterium]|nr:M67 family metallopeptidase [Rhodospirillales bacterium]